MFISMQSREIYFCFLKKEVALLFGVLFHTFVVCERTASSFSVGNK